jgi:ABC-type uncharacterized transport system substrate-binding protein
MDANFAKIEFKSLMVKIRYLSENADAELAQTMHRELEREIGVLIPKFRAGSQFLKNRSKTDLSMVESRPTG